jgi:hypothetical protein
MPSAEHPRHAFRKAKKTMKDIVQQALECAALGYRVFPYHGIRTDGRCTCNSDDCKNQGKHPIHSGWQQSASNDVEIVRQVMGYHSGCNYGITTGAGSGICSAARNLPCRPPTP